MDRLTNWTRGVNATTPTPSPGQNCVSNSSSSTFSDKFLVTAPSWDSVSQDTRWIFLLHTYGFACFFFVLGFYTFFSILNLRSLISSRPFMSTINVFLCLLGASRSACLFIDPYNLGEKMPKIISSIMWDIGFPCVTSAFCLIQLAFLQLTQLKFGPEKIQKESYLSLVITGHFFFVIASDVALTSHNCYMARYVVQTVFLVWSVILYLTFLHAGYKVMHLLRTMPNSMLTRDNPNVHQKGIMQLAILAPYSNLATSVAAALVPTLLGPRMKTSKDDGESEKVTKVSKKTHEYCNGDRDEDGQGVQDGASKSMGFRKVSPTAKTTKRAHVPSQKNTSTDNANVPLSSSSSVSSSASSSASASSSSSATSSSTKCQRAMANQELKTTATTVATVTRVSATSSVNCHPISTTVPEVYVRPPTPTPSTAILPIITVSSPSRRSSLASRRGSDVSRTSRRNSECSVRFINEEDPMSPLSEVRQSIVDFSKQSSEVDRYKIPESIFRRHSENITPSGSTKELRRCSDFSHEKNRSSQFATKLRRNSDFGNRTPRRMLPQEEQHRLPRVLDLSPASSRRNSDIGGFVPPPKSESRRNSDISYRRNSEFVQVKPLIINRRSSDISIRTLDKSPTHYQQCILVPEKLEIVEKSESDSDQPDCNEKAALMNEKENGKDHEARVRIKSLSWKNDKMKEDPVEDITAEANFLPENPSTENGVTGADFTLHSILNHIAYVNRTKSDTPLHIPEASTAAIRKSQIRRVLNVTYATAILGIILCLTDVARIFGSYGLLAETVKYGTRPAPMQFPRLWPWLLYQTFCRGLELAMGYAMASITKQPSMILFSLSMGNYFLIEIRSLAIYALKCSNRDQCNILKTEVCSNTV